jgi:hypothetical protein
MPAGDQLRNKYSLKKSGDFTVSEGHGYPLVLSNFGDGMHFLTTLIVGDLVRM